MSQEELYNKIFTENTGDVDRHAFLQKLVAEYPYFSPAHFFLLKETAPSAFNYKKIAAKTALHFNNPFLLKYQLGKRMKVVSDAEKFDETKPVHDVENFADVEQVKEIKNEEEILYDKPAANFQTEDNLGKTENLQSAEWVEASKSVQELDEPKEDNVESMKTSGDVEKPHQKEELIFEPLHTTDYFASQGIKLSEEVQTADKLGKQLKSFTEWLKTMKKIQPIKAADSNTNIDLAVQNLAEKSNKEQEVLTESMAEVFIQQGKRKKALDIYQKLSLINPSKSAYFAAKIELLKDN